MSSRKNDFIVIEIRGTEAGYIFSILSHHMTEIAFKQDTNITDVNVLLRFSIAQAHSFFKHVQFKMLSCLRHGIGTARITSICIAFIYVCVWIRAYIG